LIAIAGQLRKGLRVRVADLAAELGVTEAELASDLETMSMCGVAPFTPDEYIPVMVEDGYVEVWGELPALRGAIRLSTAEAGALAAALQAAGFEADDALTARLLAAAAPSQFDAEALEATVRTAATAHAAPVFSALSQAIEGRAVVRLEYVKGGADQASEREVEPRALFAERGAWYLTAWCRSADDWRTFRVDRIRSAGLVGESFDPSAHAHGDLLDRGSAIPAAGLPTATLRFAEASDYTEREWPGSQLRDTAADGSALVEVPFAGTAWIARQVAARMGSVEVVEPAEVRTAVRESAAAQLSELG
jgi:proteasome accessory factor C